MPDAPQPLPRNASRRRVRQAPSHRGTIFVPRILAALRYPLRGPALAAIAIFAVGRAVTAMVPAPLNWALAVIVWASAFLYALACLLRSADGYDDPPEVHIHQNQTPGAVLCVLQALGIALVLLAAHVSPVFWGAILVLAVLLPAMTLSIAFEDHLLHPRNLRTWARVMHAFGPGYLLPVALGMVQYLLVLVALRHPGPLAALLWSLPLMYVVLLHLRVTGMLTYRYHRALGHRPEADALAELTGRDADDELLQHISALCKAGDTSTARDCLMHRLTEHSAPLRVHTAYRQLLRSRGEHAALLVHAQLHLAALLAEDDLRRALGVVQECMHLDPHFMPDDPAVVGALADAALQGGMPRLALKLSRGYPNHWPRAADAPHYGLQAALILADQLQQPVEAGVLAAKLAEAYPHDPEQGNLQHLLQRLDMAGPDCPAPAP